MANVTYPEGSLEVAGLNWLREKRRNLTWGEFSVALLARPTEAAHVVR